MPTDTTPPKAVRRKPPNDRRSVIHKAVVGGYKLYLTVGFYDDGQPCELFCRMGKTASTLSGAFDSFAIAVSMALQHGVPFDYLAGKFEGQRFEPSGVTTNPQIPEATSIPDYIFRFIRLHLKGTK